MANGYVGIPTSYTPVEYIESTDTQYIDTELKTNEVSKIQATASNTFGLTYDNIPYGNSLFGARVSASNSNFQYANGTYNEFVGNGTAQLSLTRNTSTNVLTIEISKTSYSVTSQNYNISGSLSVSISTPLNIYLFGLNNNGTFSGGTWKIYTFKMYDNSNNLIRDFIPVIDQDNVACLYDLVEGKFYYNQGSGTFTAGNTTGQAVIISKARKIANGYVGINGVARKIIRGYVGINGVARLCFGNLFPTYRTTITGETTQAYNPLLANTDDYILVLGGAQTGGSTPIKTVKAYNKNGTSISAPDLTAQSWFSTGGNFNGYAICTSGKTASTGGNRTNQCLSYDNNLTKGTLTTSKDVFEASFAANSTHFMVAGGSNYSSHQSWICSYNSSFVKTTPTAMSTTRRCNSSAPVGDYIVCCGGLPNYGATDFYDNSNVRTTSTNPYGSKATYYPLGLATRNHAIFFGGATSESTSNAYSDTKAYDSNKVLTSFSMPVAMWQAQGYSTGDYACVYYNNYELIYDDNLVLQVNTVSTRSYGDCRPTSAATTGSFAIVKRNGTTELNLFDI